MGKIEDKSISEKNQCAAPVVLVVRLSKMLPCHPDEGGHVCRQAEIFFTNSRSAKKISPSCHADRRAFEMTKRVKLTVVRGEGITRFLNAFVRAGAEYIFLCVVK